MKRLAEFLEKMDNVVPAALIGVIMVAYFFRGPVGLSESRAFNSFASFWGALLTACAASAAFRLVLWPLRVLARKLAAKQELSGPPAR